MPAALHRRQPTETRAGQRASGQDQPVAVHRARPEAVRPGRIAQADLHPVLRRGLVAQLAEPPGGAGATAAGVHHQIGIDLFGLALGVGHPRAGDPPSFPRGQQAGHGVAIEHADIRQPEDALAHVALQERPAREQRGQAGVALLELMAGEDPLRVGEHITAHRPRGGHFGGEAGEQPVEYLSAPGVQAMQMTAMRHPLALLPGWWQRIPLDHRYLLVHLGQDPRGQQPGQARAENDRVIRGLAHPRSLPSRYAPCGARLPEGVSNLSSFEPPAQLGACCSDNRIKTRRRPK